MSLRASAPGGAGEVLQQVPGTPRVAVTSGETARSHLLGSL